MSAAYRERRPYSERLLSKVSVDLEGPRLVDDAPCWLWTGMQNGTGYGLMKVGGRKGGRRIAHRLVYELLIEPVPEELDLDHLCRVRHCCNPAHLEPVPPLENLLRGESPWAANARKTHCIRHHEFTPENTIRVKGGRNCRACRTEISRRYEIKRSQRIREGRK